LSTQTRSRSRRIEVTLFNYSHANGITLKRSKRR
jgi:hypothetical protein